MKLDFDQQSSTHNISAYPAEGIKVGDQLISTPFVVFGNALAFDILPSSVSDIDQTHIERLAAFKGNIILIGTGSSQEMLGPDLLHPAFDSGIGVEVMNTPAACRIYNVLIGENRSVVGAFYMP